MSLPRCHRFAVRAASVAVCLLALSATAGAGILVSLDRSGRLTVRTAEPADVEAAPPSRGLFVWDDGDGGERWAVVAPGWKRPEAGKVAARRPLLGENTRGAATGTDGGAVAQFTLQLEQISPSVGTRAAEVYLLTPSAGEQLLTSKPTFRRVPREKEPRLPAVTVTLISRALREPLRLTFGQGQQRLAFADFKGLPKELADGLPSGQYTVANVRFTVVEPKDRESVLAPIRRITELTGGKADPLALQFGVDHLLGETDEKGAPLYPSSALDLLEEAPAATLTAHLRRQRDGLLRCLEALPEDRAKALTPAAPPGEATGIKEIDEARQLIASARWGQALTALDRPEFRAKAAADKRAAGLAALYRGVVLSESGAAKEEEARAAFEEAVAALAGGAPADLFRARVNFANFLQQRANDRLNNHALQMAAGVERPMLTTLEEWLAARDQYEKALGITDRLGRGAAAGAEVNLARLYALLADVIRTLAPAVKGEPGFADGERAAAGLAEEHAAKGAQSSDEPLLRGVAEEVRALLAFRAGDDGAARTAARRALAAYLDGGHLAGAENVYRVLGLIARRAGTPSDALRQLEVAQLISESLRARFPPDRTGLGRAGFFARKAYVSELMVELLLEQGKPAQALSQLELAKARGLQDLLASRSVRPPRPSDPSGNVLEKWDRDAAAVEYFLGPDAAYVFVVSPAGKVSAFRLRDAEGRDLKSRELIARVSRLLHDLEGQSAKMFERLSNSQGYDHAWQDELHRLHGELLPAAARKELDGARVAVVVPQHILHYFPFAALVTAKDVKTAKSRMARPRFLIDEPFDLVYAPSLSAWSLLRARPAAQVRSVRAVGLVEAPGAPALEGVVKDLKNLQEVFGDRVRTVLTAEQARESAAQRLLDEPGLLFFGSHGINIADRPLDSHLLLLPDEGGRPGAADGRLTAGELFARRRPIGAELVVLSACYSGLGDRSPMPGDDLYGLQRAFLQSGTRTVISGLWDVYDGTAPELMRGLFERLEAGEPAASALAGTQRAFLAKLRASAKDEPWLHPYFWAVYTAAGDDRTRMQKR